MRKIVLFVALFLFVSLIVLSFIFASRHHSVDKDAQAAWLSNEVKRLQNLGAPAVSLFANEEPNIWAKDHFLIFSNGWAAFAYHTFHDSEYIGDVALLRTSAGDFFTSHYHFCCGEWTFNTGDRPEDISQFMEIYGAKQGWTRGEVVGTNIESKVAER